MDGEQAKARKTKADLSVAVELLDQQALAMRQSLHGLKIEITKEAKDFLIEKGTNSDFGARPLRRAIEQHVEDPLSEALIQGTITTRPAFIEVFLENDKLFYRPVGEEKTEGVLLYSN